MNKKTVAETGKLGDEFKQEIMRRIDTLSMS